MSESARLQEDLRRAWRGRISGWVFIVIGVILVWFGYALCDAGTRYSGIFLMVWGALSIAFGFILIRYSRKVV